MNIYKQLRIMNDKTQNEVAEYLGLTRPAYIYYEQGKTKPNKEINSKLAKFYGISEKMFTGEKNFPSLDELMKTINTKSNLDNNLVLIPILGRVLAGYNGIAEQEIMGYMEIEESIIKKFPDCFALEISGDSMEPEIYDGDTVIVKPCNTVQSGSVAIVCINGDEGTIKRVKISNQGITVIPTNQRYKPITYTPEQIKELPVRINGQVIQVRHNYF